MNNENNKIWYGIIGIVIGLLLAGAFYPMMRYGGFGMMGWGNNSPYSQRAGSSKQASDAIDRHFIEQMIPHHDGAIAMASLALQKAKRPEIKALATDIISAQTAEIENMKDWYSKWFGRTVPAAGLETGGMMNGGMMAQGGMHMGGQEDIDTLKNAADFDKTFIEQMIPHHQLAIMMANMLQYGTARPEMEQLAEDILDSQSEEIRQMRVWYNEWYR